jgi:hypothetical protein
LNPKRPINCSRWLPLLGWVGILLYGCAAQGPPGGGPEDKSGPKLLYSIPESGATNISTSPAVTLFFSELINPRSAEGNLTITPALKRAPRFKVNRKKITINFSESLAENTTYIINFGRSLQDYQSNPTPANITLAFATGDSLDQGQINGKLFGIPDKYYVFVWAYRRGVSFPDSILGAVPDYRITADMSGEFQLKYLAPGEYRLLAIAAPTPRIIQVAADNLIALPAVDPVTIHQRGEVVGGINFRLGNVYVNRFKLQSASTKENRLELIFSRALSVEQSRRAVIKVSDEPEATIRSFWINDTDARYASVFLQGLKPGGEYYLMVDSIFDDSGEAIGDLDRSVKFTWLAKPDTSKPALESAFPPNGTRDIDPGMAVRLNFSEAIQIPVVTESVALMQPDSTSVPYQYFWQDGNSLVIRPEGQLGSATTYKIRANTSGWTDLAGNPFADSSLSLNFTIVDVNSFGSITGKIQTADSLILNNLVIGCLAEKQSVVRYVKPATGGLYQLTDLLPGKYRIMVWEDRNGNMVWDPGRLLPFECAEPCRFYPEWINVRARWETAEVNLIY